MKALDVKKLLERFQEEYTQLKCKDDSFSIIELGKELISIKYDRVLRLSYVDLDLEIFLKNGLIYRVPRSLSTSCVLTMRNENFML